MAGGDHSSQRGDIHSRFAHLLQPIRDLTKNWDVDVASHLEEYLDEIESITISFDGGATKMNFAEAALVIQGSTCVYSKKVEYLYALVYQTMDLIASKKKLAQATSVDDQGRDKDVSFAERKEHDEFLTLNDLPVGTNIDMVEGSKCRESKCASTIPRTPMSLIPLQDCERAISTPLLSHTGEVLGSRLDFKMNTSILHSTGALLLEPINQMVIEVKLANKEPIPISYDTPADKVKALLTPGDASNTILPPDVSMAMEMDHDGGFDGYSDDEGAGPDEPAEMGPDDDKSKVTSEPVKRRRSLRLKIKEEKVIDPWKLLDPHDPGTLAENKPYKKGTTFRLLSSLKKTASRKRKSVSMSPSEPLAQFLLKSFYSCSSMFPKNPLKAPQSSEFEGLYWAEQKNRMLQKHKENITLSRLHKESAIALEQQVKETEDDDDDEVEGYQPMGEDYSDHDDNALGGGLDEMGGVDAGFDGAFEGFTEGGGVFQGVEPMALDDQSHASTSGGEKVVQNYEDLVRNYVESTMAGVLTYLHETDLSKRVQEWERRIKPRLLMEEQHAAFDIHLYGSNVLKEFEQGDLNDKDKECLSFSEVVKNHPPFEISRMFAATLQLANNHNVLIDSTGSGETAVNTMKLKLLSLQMPHQAVTDYRAPSLHQ